MVPRLLKYNLGTELIHLLSVRALAEILYAARAIKRKHCQNGVLLGSLESTE
jgi:hypothetical protein